MRLSNDGKLRFAIKSALFAGMATGSHTVAHAQTAPAPTTGASSESTELEKIEVTGSRLPQLNLTSTSAMVILTDEELKLQGTVNVESLLNIMPQVFAEYSTGDSNGALGTATVNLRNLGSQRTLVLIDGKRLGPGDPRAADSRADLNFIPAALIDSIEIRSGGESAVYGSDAVAGVVNFKMKRDYEGFMLDADGSQTDEGDGTTRNVTGVWGNNFAGGSGNVTVYAGYINKDAVTQAQRDFSACSLTTPASGLTHRCAGSRVIAEGRFLSYDRYYSANPAVNSEYYRIIDPAGTRNLVVDDNRTFNFAPYNYLQRPQTRWNLGAFAHREINTHIDVYADAMFMDDHTVAQIAPSGLFGQRVAVPCNSPLLSAGEVQWLCTDPGLLATDSADVAILKRTTEVGPRQDDLRHTDYRYVVGTRGNIFDDINYDIMVQRGEVIFAESYLNDLSVSRAQDALNGCASGNTKCVPLDLFQLGAITTGMADYVRGIGISTGSVIEQLTSGAVTADLGRYGVKIPSASTGIKLALGAEHRSEALDFRPDFSFQNGDLAGQGGETPPVGGGYQVDEWFTEMQLPLINDMVGAYNLQFDGAYRKSDYSLAGPAETYKLGLQYAPTADVALRGSFQRAVRAPAIGELFLPNSFGLFGFSDPCAGANLAAAGANAPTQAQCANTGVTAAQYTGQTILDCNAGQCNGLFGGNLALKPEESDTHSYGIVFTPTFVKDLQVTVDYFDISIDGAVTAAPTVEFTQCLLTGDPTYCSYIHRGGTGRLSGSTANNNNYVEAPLLNAATFETKGWDVAGDYKLGLGGFGKMSFSYQATLLDTLEVELGPGTGKFDCAGLYGITCGVPTPKYKHKFRTTYTMPMGLALSANWRYIGESTLDTSTSDPNLSSAAGQNNQIDRTLKVKQYLDLAGSYTIPYGSQKYDIRFGASNVFGVSPQTVSSGNPNPVSAPPFGNGNTFPNVYDGLSRVFFLGLNASF